MVTWQRDKLQFGFVLWFRKERRPDEEGETVSSCCKVSEKQINLHH